MKTLGWGILGTGRIAQRFARGLKYSRTGKLVAVASRKQETADEFVQKHGGRGYEGYENLLEDKEVHVVYISLPHHMHTEWSVRAARNGKHILCEKPFALDAKEAEWALEEIRKHGVFFMEAFMYRCHPQTIELQKRIAEGAIGEPLYVYSEHGFEMPRDADDFRLVNRYGGGALMDVGCYCVSFARMVSRSALSRAVYVAKIGSKKYDEYGTGCLFFENDLSASFCTSIHLSLSNHATIYGTKGRIEIPSPWHCDKPFRIVSKDDTVEEVSSGLERDLYSFEADAVMEFLEKREAPYVTWQDTLEQAYTLDMLRESASLVFEK